MRHLTGFQLPSAPVRGAARLQKRPCLPQMLHQLWCRPRLLPAGCWVKVQVALAALLQALLYNAALLLCIIFREQLHQLAWRPSTRLLLLLLLLLLLVRQMAAKCHTSAGGSRHSRP